MVHLVARSYASALIRPAAETQFMQELKRLIHADAVHITHANGRGVARALMCVGQGYVEGEWAQGLMICRARRPRVDGVAMGYLTRGQARGRGTV